MPSGPSTGGRTPPPETCIALWRPTSTDWPTASSTLLRVSFASTATDPRLTETSDEVFPAVTTKRVPLTTATRWGVSTAKCRTCLTSASTATVPKYSLTVVNGMRPGLSKIWIWVLGPRSMVSAPRVRVMRPFIVRMTRSSGTMEPRSSFTHSLSTMTNTAPRSFSATQSSANAPLGINERTSIQTSRLRNVRIACYRLLPEDSLPWSPKRRPQALPSP